MRPGDIAAAAACADQRCGRPQDGPGAPRRGWVNARQAGPTSKAPERGLWFCSWHCLSRFAIHAELGGGDAHMAASMS